jgi:predicted ATPase
MFDALHLDHFRCFRAPQTVPVAPLTLLVGENSAGKSSFLAAARLAADIGLGKTSLDFNEAPFSLGAFDQIANYPGGSAKRSDTFALGFTVGVKKPTRVEAMFRKRGAQPDLCQWSMTRGDSVVRVAEASGEGAERMTVEVDGKQISTQYEVPLSLVVRDWEFLSFLFRRETQESDTPTFSDEDARRLAQMYSQVQRRLRHRPHAVSPIRTRPRRTYDPGRDTPEPDGGHVPMVMARLLNSRPDEWKGLIKRLEAFGKSCGLFKKVKVRRLGRSEASPFQIQVQVSGAWVNLVDVGYGVSQALPILVDTFLAPDHSSFLLQQPEVHLHPRAQAELGSYLAALVRDQGKRIIAETHSDHLIDRICMEIRDGFLSPKDVRILYFERAKADVKVFPIDVDEMGNLKSPPESYRTFFLEEESRLLFGGA